MKGVKKFLVGVIAVFTAFTLTSCGLIFNLAWLWGSLFEQEISLEYTLTQEDLTEFTSLAQECEEAGMAGSRSFYASFTMMMDRLSYIEAQSTVGYLEYCMNQTDSLALQHYTESERIYSSARTQYLELLKKLEAESPMRDQLFADWSEENLKMLRVDNDKISDIQLSTSELQRKFYELDQKSATWSHDVSVIYEDVVENNQALAKEYGYSNYYEFADELVYGRNYTAEQRTAFRYYVGEYVVPMYATICAAYDSAIDSFTSSDQAELEAIYSNKEYLYGYMDTFDGSLKNKMYAMFERPNAVLYGESEDSLEGAFTTYMGYFEQPIAYFGPGYGGLYTVIHEMGHYAAYYYYEDGDLPFDLAETHSQGNEWLLTSYLKTEVSPKIYNALLLKNLAGGLLDVIYSTLVDHFEELVYTAATPVKANEYEQIMESVCAQYKGLETVTEGHTPIFEYAQYVTVISPGYYLSYATSQIAAIGIYVLAEEQGYQTAVDAYTLLQEGMDLDATFAEALTAAGLPGPFSEDTYIKLKNVFLK